MLARVWLMASLLMWALCVWWTLDPPPDSPWWMWATGTVLWSGNVLAVWVWFIRPRRDAA